MSLKIKSESNAQRCEVCHQIDFFDPVSAFCSRCQTTSTKQISLNKELSILNTINTLNQIAETKVNKSKFYGLGLVDVSKITQWSNEGLIKFSIHQEASSILMVIIILMSLCALFLMRGYTFESTIFWASCVYLLVILPMLFAFCAKFFAVKRREIIFDLNRQICILKLQHYRKRFVVFPFSEICGIKLDKTLYNQSPADIFYCYELNLVLSQQELTFSKLYIKHNIKHKAQEPLSKVKIKVIPPSSATQAIKEIANTLATSLAVEFIDKTD